MAIVANCEGAPTVAIEVTADVTNGVFRWQMAGSASNPPDITISPFTGNLDFGRRRGRVLVTMHIASPGFAWRENNTIEYNDAPVRGNRQFVRPGNHQIQFDTPTGSDLTFCYRNLRRGGNRHGGDVNVKSYYGLWVTYQGASYYIDPIITNGGSPAEEDA